MKQGQRLAFKKSRRGGNKNTHYLYLTKILMKLVKRGSHWFIPANALSIANSLPEPERTVRPTSFHVPFQESMRVKIYAICLPRRENEMEICCVFHDAGSNEQSRFLQTSARTRNVLEHPWKSTKREPSLSAVDFLKRSEKCKEKHKLCNTMLTA